MYGLTTQDRDGGKVHLEAPVDEWYGRSFAALGDSIVWAGGPMLNRMRARLGFATYRNLGVSGRPMADGTSAGGGTVTTALANSFAADAMVYIAAGTNDFKLDVPLGTIGPLTQTSHSRTTFYGAYRTVLDYLLAQNSGMQIILATPLQRNNAGYTTTTTNAAGHTLADYRAAVFALGGMYSLPVVDMYSLSGISEKTLGLYTTDGLHPNEQGYIRMARVAIGAIRGGGAASSAHKHPITDVQGLTASLDAIKTTAWQECTGVTTLTAGTIWFRWYKGWPELQFRDAQWTNGLIIPWADLAPAPIIGDVWTRHAADISQGNSLPAVARVVMWNGGLYFPTISPGAMRGNFPYSL